MHQDGSHVLYRASRSAGTSLEGGADALSSPPTQASRQRSTGFPADVGRASRGQRCRPVPSGSASGATRHRPLRGGRSRQVAWPAGHGVPSGVHRRCAPLIALAPVDRHVGARRGGRKTVNAASVPSKMSVARRLCCLTQLPGFAHRPGELTRASNIGGQPAVRASAFGHFAGFARRAGFRCAVIETHAGGVPVSRDIRGSRSAPRPASLVRRVTCATVAGRRASAPPSTAAPRQCHDDSSARCSAAGTRQPPLCRDH